MFFYIIIDKNRCLIMIKKILISLFIYMTILHATLPTQNNVSKLYVATFNRAPDAAGLNFWIFDSGFPLEDIARSFFDQPETRALYPDGTTTLSFIRSIYSNLFNREPDAEGQAYWVDALDTGKVSKSVFILAVVNGALGNDAEILNNKTLVGLTYALKGLDDINLARAVMKNVNASIVSVSNAMDMMNGTDVTYTMDTTDTTTTQTSSQATQPIATDNGITEEDTQNTSQSNTQSSNKENLDTDQDYLSFWKSIVHDLNLGSTYSAPSLLYYIEPNTSTCNKGSLSNEAKERALQVTNAIRDLHGLAPFEYNHDFDAQVQAASLIMKANNKIDHMPASSSKCYTQEGYDASSTSDLSLSHRIVDPAKDIATWVDDATNASVVSAVGHRRWILNPFGKYTSYGQIDGFSTLKVVGFNDASANDVNVEYVAFPYKRYPYILISNSSPWSFSIVEDRDDLYANTHDYFSNATVIVREKESGKSLTISKLYHDSIAYGVPNILTWSVSGWQKDTLYEVTISNVNMQSSNKSTFTYDVFIDYTALQ